MSLGEFDVPIRRSIPMSTLHDTDTVDSRSTPSFAAEAARLGEVAVDMEKFSEAFRI